MSEPTILDTETTGFHGIIVLMQAAIGEEEPQLFCPWNRTVSESLEWMEHYYLNTGGVVGFNLTFDWFHICKMHTMLTLFKKKYGKHEFMEDFIPEVAALEKEARFGDCLKPYGALDLMLHSKKGEFQSLMDRKDIRIRRVPYALAEKLVATLSEKIVLPDMYFSRRKDASVRWQTQDIENDLGEIIPDLVDVVLKFAPSSSLKALAIATGIQNKATRLMFEDVAIPKQFMSNEPGWAPFADAPFKLDNGRFVRPSPENWYGRWPEHLEYHIQHWSYNEKARTYAADDIHDTRGLYNYFGRPDLGDDDCELACMVGATRWRGFAIDRVGLQAELKNAEEELKKYNFNWNSPAVCRKVLEQHMDEDLRALITGTRKEILEDVVKWEVEDVCDACYGDGCKSCKGGSVSTGERHPAALDAELILSARRTSKKKGDITKLLMNDRFHPDFKIIGTKSSRMSGTGGLNAQGISSAPVIRKCFTMADAHEALSGGDFDAFEVTIADATYNDPALRADLLADVKIHATMGAFLSGLTYDEVVATKGLVGREDKYALGKMAIFALFYGGDEGTLVRKTGIDIDQAEEAMDAWAKKYPVMQEGRKAVINAHTCMSQPKGIGTPVNWKEPAGYVESMFGFKRFFTLENMVCKALFELATKPPKDWFEVKGSVIRRDKPQTSVGACRSSLFGAAFGISSGVIRAALNHKIQSSGSNPTKNLQRRLWDLQPCGIHPMVMRNLQVHDEILVVSPPELTKDIIRVKDEFLLDFKKQIPLLNITWDSNMSDWSNTH